MLSPLIDLPHLTTLLVDHIVNHIVQVPRMAYALQGTPT